MFVEVGGQNVLYATTPRLDFIAGKFRHMARGLPFLLLPTLGNTMLVTGFLYPSPAQPSVPTRLSPSARGFPLSDPSQSLGNSILLAPGSDAVCQGHLSSPDPLGHQVGRAG